MRLLLILGAIALAILAIASIPVVLMVSVMCFDAPGSTRQLGPILIAVATWMVPVALFGTAIFLLLLSVRQSQQSQDSEGKREDEKRE